MIVEIKKVELTKLKTGTKNIFTDLSDVDIGTIIEMALSDHTPFSEIQLQYGLKEDQEPFQ